MSYTQLSELRSNVRVIDVATTPLLSVAECADVIASCSPDDWYTGKRRATTSADVLAGREIEQVLDPAAKSRLEQALPGGPGGDLANRIAARVLEINEEVYGFRLVGVEDPVRVLCYRGAYSDHQSEHIDVGPQHPLRKLAFSISLSEPDDFVGGDLVFSSRVFDLGRVQGTLTVFPSYLPHTVRQVEQGTRHVIVGWVLGPSFI